MALSFIKKLHIYGLGLSLSLLLVACAGATQPTSTATPQPTFTLEPTFTPKPTSTPELTEGDAEKGFLTAIRYSCKGCHTNDEYLESGPRFTASDDLQNIFERGEIRIADPDYQGRASTNFEYIIESILLPQAYFVPGEWPDAMSTFTIHKITDQEMADIIAWMRTLE